MKSTVLQKGTLALSALIALGIGAAIVFAPTAFYAVSTVTLPDSVNLLNDIRGFGGGLVAVAIFIGLGLFYQSFTFSSLVAGAMIFAGFGFARIWAITVDGFPDTTYIWVLVIELFLAAMAAVCVYKTSKAQS